MKSAIKNSIQLDMRQFAILITFASNAIKKKKMKTAAETEEIMCAQNWNEARLKIEKVITVKFGLDTGRSHNRKVLKINDMGFNVQKGSSENSYNNVSYKRLETCWNTLHKNGQFNCHLFDEHFPEDRKGSGCWTGIIGEIFVRAGFARRIQDRPFLIYEEVRC